MAGLVAENFGIAIMPQIPILDQLEVDIVQLRRQHQIRHIYMTEKKETYQPPLVKKFRDFVIARQSKENLIS